MIGGIGIDIVRVARIRCLLAKYPERFPQRILHPRELADYGAKKDKAAFLARRFAAKEAISKALGCGFANRLQPSAIAIQSDRRGKPYVAALATLEDAAAANILLSISDEVDYAIAQAVVVSPEQR